jgi:hypothetical protein
MKEPKAASSVATELSSLKKLKSIENRFVSNYSGHICWGQFLNCIPVEKDVLDSCITLCGEIMKRSCKFETVDDTACKGHLKQSSYKNVKITFDDRFIEQNA